MINAPVLDKFARESARFDRFYVSPLCAPTRASLLTGRYHLRTGTVSVSQGLEIMQSSEVTLGEVFKSNGYKTGLFGKWHNGQHMPNHPMGQGFDEFFGFCGGHWSNYFDTELEHNGKKVLTKGYITDILTEKAIDFIETNKDKPFLCYVPYNAPHSPHQVPDVYFDKYKAKGLNDELASVYGMVENMDSNIGRLLQKLEDTGLSEETIVIFLTDNGPNGVRFNGGMKGIKGSVDEGGVRVPCFWRWTGSITPLNIKTPGAHIDILPTLVELCGLTNVKTKPLDGVSLASALYGKSPQSNRKLFTHVAFPQLPIVSFPGAVRDYPYTLIVGNQSAKLYDIRQDSAQQQDRTKDYPEVTSKLMKDYEVWFAEVTKEIKPVTVIPLSPLSGAIELPTYEATFTGNLRYKEGHGWVHDWLVNWTAASDSIYWEVNSPAKKYYTVFLNYTCPTDQVGSDIQVSAGSDRFVQRISIAYDPPYITSPDRVKRKEAYEKTWKRVKVGRLLIPEGQTRITVTAPRIARREVGEIKSIELVRQ
jgi:arylsulfatase A